MNTLNSLSNKSSASHDLPTDATQENSGAASIFFLVSHHAAG